MSEVTAMMLNRDEPTFEKSLRSIVDHVSKVVVVDSSRHDHKVREVCKQYSNVHFYKSKPHYPTQMLIALSHVDTRWAMRWDSDFFAMENIDFLLKLTNELSQGIYTIEYGVMDRQTNKPHYEPYLFTVKETLLKKRANIYLRKIACWLKKKPKPRIPWLPFPRHYEVLRLKSCYALHAPQRPKWRELERKHQIEWGLLSKKKRKGRTFEEFIAEREPEYAITPKLQ